MSLAAWNALDAELKSIVAHACAVEANFALAGDGAAQHRGAGGADRQHRGPLRAFPADLIAAARAISGRGSGRSRRQEREPPARYTIRMWRSASATGAWSRISLKAVLEAREG